MAGLSSSGGLLKKQPLKNSELDPHRLGMILTLTGELYRSSNAEAVFRQTLIESAGPTLDALF
jgi:hypothetical protein